MTDAAYRALEADYRGLLISEAKRWTIPGEELSDLIQEARIALWKAAEAYDPTKGASLSTLTVWGIRWRLDHLQRAGGSSRGILDDSLRVETFPDQEIYCRDVWDVLPAILEERENAELLWSLAEALDEEQREILRRLIREESHAEIGQAIGCTGRAVFTKRGRMLAALQQEATCRGLAIGHPIHSGRRKTDRRMRAVRCVETGETFRSVNAAALASGLNDRTLAAAIRRGKPTAGRHWEVIGREQGDER